MDEDQKCTERELLNLVAEGCERSFEALFQKYHGLLYHYSLKIFRDEDLADEVVHKTFIKIWNLRGSLSEIQSFKNYIFSINRNLAIDELKAISRKRHLTEELKCRIISSHNLVEEGVIFNDLNGIALEAVEKLPAKRKEIFKLSRLEGFSHREIANKLNISENTVKVSVHKSLKQVRNYMTINTDVSFSSIVLLIPAII